MTQRSAESIRIGCVKYLNAQPLIYGWPGPIDLDHPAALCRKLADGRLDVALVSSFEFLRNPIYAIADGVSVGADGPVYSVFLAFSGEIEEVQEIDLDPASQTSANLLRCLLAGRRLNPRIEVAAVDNKNLITQRRARLMIGDQAIRFREFHGGRYQYWDLSAEWKALTGLPFVFALWLIRPEVENAAEIARALRQRRDENLSALNELIAAQKEFAPEFCAHYFRDCLRFGLGDDEKKGLLTFRTLCEGHGILPSNPGALRLV